MTVLTPVQVANYWVGAGGPKSRAVEWLAIAMGESGLDDTIVSPAGAVGLWQIMPFNAPPYGYSTADLYNPAVNAHIAVAMSGGGTNCAAWDSCYLNIYRSGRYTFLAWPEVGSADYINLSYATAALRGQGLPGVTSASPVKYPPSLDGEVAKMNAMADQAIPGLTEKTARLGPVIQRMMTRGWRP